LNKDQLPFLALQYYLFAYYSYLKKKNVYEKEEEQGTKRQNLYGLNIYLVFRI